jgi:hypothetical protein
MNLFGGISKCCNNLFDSNISSGFCSGLITTLFPIHSVSL